MQDELLLQVAEVLSGPAQIIDEVARDTVTGPAWAAARDPDTVPEELLEWLAQHVGVDLPPGVTVAEKRSRIRQAAGFFEGTTASEVTEIQRVLTGTKTVRVAERVDGDQWQQTIATRTAETPDPGAVVAAWLRQKPAGIVATHVVTDDVLWAEATLDWADVDAGVTWDTVAVGDV